MVRLVEQEKKKEQAEDIITSRLFLNSIKSWFNDTGVFCSVKSVGKIYDKKNGGKGVAVKLNILDMSKCRGRVIDDKGEVVQIEDDEGEMKDEIQIVNDPEEVTFFYNVGKLKDNPDEFQLNPLSSAYPLVKYAFLESELIEEDTKKNIVFNHEELKEALVDLEFMAKMELKKVDGLTPYPRLIPVPVSEVEAEVVE
ncbi:hypothetical protein [Methanobrevibacter sp. DSM 116169]|uniref:hypothetical protein n=1 Tax=Methanobrevibacter sp. DSM 116169 TaxID=3242727 RepID=UPI0038FC4A65